MKTNHPVNRVARLLCLTLLTASLAACGEGAKNAGAQPKSAKAALTVATIVPQRLDWPLKLKADGNVVAWQEAVIGPELSNYRITEVNANVGDEVRKGQVLARIAADTVENDLAEARTAVVEAEATFAEAKGNHERAKQLQEKGFFSSQQTTQAQTAANTALARLNAAKARLRTAELKRAKAAVLASDDGIISGRAATVGTLTQPGQELFRLIRGGRLEWRAEVTSSELFRLKPGQVASLTGPNGNAVQGVVRAVAPTVDPQTRNALVYVDLPATARRLVSAGMFARGEFLLGQHSALTLPQSAVLLRDGFSYVFRVDGDKATLVKVGIGRRNGERIEVSGLDPQARVVAGGVAFLADGDTVRVVQPPAAKTSQP